MVTALVPYKRVDQAIAACASLGRSLKIVGEGPERKSLMDLSRRLGAPPVEFLGFVSDEELLTMYGRARGLIFPGVEDFGLVPLEAIAALQKAIVRFEARQFSDRELRMRASQFTREQFTRKFQAILRRAIGDQKGHQPVCA